MRYKVSQLQDLITFNGIDVLALSETWLTENIADNEVCLAGYRLFRFDRKVQSCRLVDPDSAYSAVHGGVCIFVKDHLRAVPVNINVDPSLEILPIRLTSYKHLPDYTIVCLYRPPSSLTHYWYLLQDALEQLESVTGCNDLIVLGDFNVNMLTEDKIDCPKRQLLNLMSSFNLKNTVESATRTTDRSQSCIDLILTNSPTHQKTCIEECAFSDHDLVVAWFGTASRPKKRTSTVVETRNLRTVSMEAFKQALDQNSLPPGFWDVHSIDEMWSIWTRNFKSALDTVAPVKKRCLRRHSCPFLTPELLNLIHERKRFYRLLRKPGADHTTLFPAYRSLRRDANNLYRQLRNSYYQKCCQEYSQDPKQLWNVIRSISGRCKPRLCLLASPNSLNNFFKELVSDHTVSHNIPFGPANETDFTSFQEVSSNQIRRLLESLNTRKATGSDEVPASLLRGCADIFSQSITWLFNKSLRSGEVPKGFKKANIIPLLKSSRLDATAPCSYRGISLLPIMSKLLEKVVEEQLVRFLKKKNTLSEYQFGFRRGRSTEDLLAKAVSDWSSNTDNGLSTVVVFMDLSKAFDKVLHQAILFTLQKAGVGGVVLKWFSSYLSDRQQRVCVNSSKCSYQAVQRGVPQGSILGPLLFNLCLAHLPSFVAMSVPSAVLLLFADDKTLYASSKSPHDAAKKVSKALSATCAALHQQGLAVNVTKTVFMVLGPPSVLAKTENVTVQCDSFTLKQVHTHRCLGLLVDHKLSWSEHVNATASKVSQRIGCLKRIWRQLSPKARRLFFISVIQPCLEYGAVVTCTALNQRDRDRLLALHRRGVRVVCGASSRDDVAPFMATLQVSKLESRWLVQLLVFAFRCLSLNAASAPTCLRELFFKGPSNYNTRGIASGSLVVPLRGSKCGRNCFDFRLTMLWNSPSPELRSAPSLFAFKRNLSVLLSDHSACDRLFKLAFCPPSDL